MRIAEPVPPLCLPEMILRTAEDRLDPDSYTSTFTYSRAEFGEVDTVRGWRFKLVSGTDDEELRNPGTESHERTNRIGGLPEVAEPLREYLEDRRRTVRDRSDVVRAVRRVVGAGPR